MFKIIVMLSMLILALAADEQKNSTTLKSTYSDSSVGIILSYGEGRGLAYRINFEDAYIQNAGYIYFSKDQNYKEFSADYSVSYGKYLIPDSKSYFHFKALVGLEGTYEIDSSHYYDEKNKKDRSYTTTNRSIMVSGGFGVEMGRREKGEILYGVDALYIFRYNSIDDYGLTPGIGIYALYNF